MAMTVEIPLNDAATTGRYIFTFKPKVLLSLIPTINTPKTVNILGYTVTLEAWEKDTEAQEVRARVNVVDNDKDSGETYLGVPSSTASSLSGIALPATYTPVTPVAAPAGALLAIGIGVMALAGLTLAMLSLSKVERIVENPGVNVALIAVGIIALVILWKNVKPGA